MLKTEALYYSDRYMKECQARLLSVDIVDGKIYMVFDRTLFFPGGGGQAQDGGYVIDDCGIKFDICGNLITNIFNAFSISLLLQP